MRAVAEAFNLTGGPDEIIKNYDRIALATERRDLMTRPWHEEIWRPYDLPKPRNEEITPWSHEIARERFLARHWELKQRIILEKARGVRIDD